MSETASSRPLQIPRRWLLSALLLVVALGLFFWLGPHLEPAGRLSALEVLP